MQQGIRQTNRAGQCARNEIPRPEVSQPGGARRQEPEEEVQSVLAAEDDAIRLVEQDQDEVIAGRARDREESPSLERGHPTSRYGAMLKRLRDLCFRRGMREELCGIYEKFPCLG